LLQPIERLPSLGKFIPIGAAAVITVIANALIIVAHNGGISSTDALHYFIGENAIPDQVTQAETVLETLPFDIIEHCI
jgi:hypothetical protein